MMMGLPQVKPSVARLTATSPMMPALELKPHERQRGDQPFTVLGVVGHRRIGGCSVGSVLIVHGQAREVAIFPGFTAVGGSGIADVGAAPADGSGAAGHVKGADDGVAPCEGVGLDFCFVIAVAVGEIVNADSYQRSLCGHREREGKSEYPRGSGRGRNFGLKQGSENVIGYSLCEEFNRS
jgi:hypothetical protein